MTAPTWRRGPAPIGIARSARACLARTGIVTAIAQRAGLAGIVVGLAACGPGGDSPGGLLLVTIDTCRADRISCYGGASAPATPAVDSVAEQGVLFLDATAPAPLTLPSHCSIFTGLYPDRHSVRDNGAGRLPDEAETLAEILRARGFATAAFVSAFPVESKFGTAQGFDLFDDDFTGSAVGLEKVPGHSEDVARRLFYDERVASEVVDRALPWIERARQADAPFFAWVHFFDPHAMYRPPSHLAVRYGPDSYDGEVAFVDEQIGRLLEGLGRTDDVTVVITADHGESLGQHDEVTHGLFLYQSSLEVPWVMSGPGVPRGARVAEPVTLVQVMPTILDALGIDPPGDLDAGSALPLARPGNGRAVASPDAAGDAAAAEAEFIFGECLFPRIHYDWAALRFVREGNLKLIDAPRPELFDLASDPDETVNLAARRPSEVERLRAELEDHFARGGELSSEELAMDDETRARLEALGYVGGQEVGASRVAADPWNREGKDPKDMVGFFNRLQEVPTLMIAGRNAEADSLLAELHAADPRNRNVLEKIALLRRFEEDWEAAKEWCERILALDPDDVQIRQNLAFTLLRLDDRAGARIEYERILAEHPSDSETWGLLGSLLSQDGVHAEAIRAFGRAVDLAPRDASIRAAFARAWEDSGDAPRALREYDLALEAEPSLSSAVNGKALLLSHGGRPREAVEVLRRGLSGAPEDVEILNNLAWILTNESIDPSEGYRHARLAARLAPDDPVILDTLGWAAIRSGRPAEAIAPLSKAWQETADPEVRAHLGIALIESGRAEEGRAHLREAVAARSTLMRIPEVSKWH